MKATIYATISLSILIFLSPIASANEIQKGSIILNDYSQKTGYISYRRLDVPTRVVFYEKDSSTNTPIDSTKTIYGPNELRGFSYGLNENWITVDFTKKELGYKAAYFMEVKNTNGDFSLLGGIITGEGCNCSGTKISASYYWVLYNNKDRSKLILATKRHERIKQPEWVAAFYAQYGHDFESTLFRKPKEVLAPLNDLKL